MTINGDDCDICSIAIPGCPTCRDTELGTVCIQSCSLARQEFTTASGCSSCNNAAGLYLNRQATGCASCSDALLNCAQCEAGPHGTLCVGCNISEQKFMYEGNNFCTQCFNE